MKYNVKVGSSVAPDTLKVVSSHICLVADQKFLLDRSDTVRRLTIQGCLRKHLLFPIGCFWSLVVSWCIHASCLKDSRRSFSFLIRKLNAQTVDTFILMHNLVVSTNVSNSVVTTVIKTQNFEIFLKCSLVPLPLTLVLDNHWFLPLYIKFVVSRALYKWNHRIFTLFSGFFHSVWNWSMRLIHMVACTTS